MVGGIASSGSLTSASGLIPLRGGNSARGGRTQATDAVGENGQTLTSEQQQQVQKLKQADASVRQHEAAHQAAGGSFAGGASFTYTRGPDGKNYATAGEVPIDISRESDPASTITKMEQIKAAALAPADPSPQDARVAAQADALKAQAQQELRQSGGTTGSADGQGGTASSTGNSSSTGGNAAGGNMAGGNAAGDGGTNSAQTTRGLAAYGAAQRLGARTSQGLGLSV